MPIQKKVGETRFKFNSLQNLFSRRSRSRISVLLKDMATVFESCKMLARWFFWSVYLIVVLGVIKAISWVEEPSRWYVLVFFVLILLFIAWTATQGRDRS